MENRARNLTKFDKNIVSGGAFGQKNIKSLIFISLHSMQAERQQFFFEL